MEKIYSNNGYARMKTLTISRGEDSSIYSFVSQFVYNSTTYPSLTDEQLQKMDRTSYIDRLRSFVNYIYSINEGLQSDCPYMAQGAEIYNTDWCPITGPSSEYNWDNIQS